MLLVPIVIMCTILWYVINRIKNKKIYDFMSSIDSSSINLPIVGCLINVLLALSPKRIYDVIMKTGQSVSAEKLVATWVGSRPILFINNPEYIKDALTNPNSTSRSNYITNAMKPWIGESILVVGPPKWRHNRRLIQQTFSQKKLESFISTFVRHGKILIECLRSQVDGGLFDIEPYMAKMSADTICATTLGVELSTQTKIHVPFFEWVKYAQDEVVKRGLKVWLNPNFIFKLTPEYKTHMELTKSLHEFLEKIIQRKKVELANNEAENDDSDYLNEKKNKNFLDFILDLNKDNVFSDKDISDESLTIFSAGYETTAITLSVVLIILGSHLEIQQKVHDEIIRVIGPERTDLDYNDLTKMKYLEMVVKETLRIHASVPVIPRVTIGEVPLSNGKTIPKGIECIIIPTIVHTDPELWPNPDEFNPDRFLPEAVNKRHPYSYLPFGGGLRNCIGYKYAMMNLLTVLALLIRNYEFFTPLKYKDLKFGYSISKKIFNGCNVQIKLRQTPVA